MLIVSPNSRHAVRPQSPRSARSLFDSGGCFPYVTARAVSSIQKRCLLQCEQGHEVFGTPDRKANDTIHRRDRWLDGELVLLHKSARRTDARPKVLSVSVRCKGDSSSNRLVRW